MKLPRMPCVVSFGKKIKIVPLRLVAARGYPWCASRYVFVSMKIARSEGMYIHKFYFQK